MEEIAKEEINFDDHFVTLRDENYDRGGKRLTIERVQHSDIMVFDREEMNVDLSLVVMSELMKLHQASGEALADFLG